MKQAYTPKLLITGINGLIGTVLQHGLANAFEIYGVERAGGATTSRIFIADLSDYAQTAAVFQQLEAVDYVVHLAADSNLEASWQSVLQNNIIGTKNLYEAARVHGVKKVVFASSNHVTGAYEGLSPHRYLHEHYEPPLIHTQDPIRPDSDYGVSKAFGEALARYYCARWGLESICLRIGSVLRHNDPTKSPRQRKTWLSHRDLVQLIQKSLLSKVTFGIYYGVSNNKGRFWDIANAQTELGYFPEDDASSR
jgi:nucleoside-diphosphate-sugar epimerase